MKDETAIQVPLGQLRGQFQQWGTLDLQVFVITKDELRGWIRGLEWVLDKTSTDMKRRRLKAFCDERPIIQTEQWMEKPKTTVVRSPIQVITDAEAALGIAKLGLEAIRRNSPMAKAVGLRNVAVFGRSVTFVLQNLRRNLGKEFDRWYEPFKEEMRADPLLRFFASQRNAIEKQGLTPAVSSTAYEAKRPFRIPDDLGPRPPGAGNAFLDASGAGWMVSTSSNTEKFYVELPEDKIAMHTYVPDAPDTHRGKQLSNPSLEELCELYVIYLQDMIEEAKKKWPGESSPR